MSNPLFTVVIPTFNREHTLKKAIKSVLKQTFERWLLLIVDDGSTDNSEKVVKAFLNDKRITYVKLKENVGISKVMNHALSMVDTPYFVQLDSDDWFERRTLKEFNKAIQKASKETALFYGNVNIVKEKDGELVVKSYMRHRSFENKYDFLRYFKNMLQPRCFRTEAVRSVGGWDTNDPFEGRLMEDRRICLKLIDRYPIYWIDKHLGNRRKHGNQLTQKNFIEHRNLLRRQVIEYYLNKWGSQYLPVYTTNKSGYLQIAELVEKN
ncbi:glycosyltransferase family 2 protein [Ammoniphilus sp. CFH 90114]|uniref:glycosyltransferase family 2 protein n=1 Tax=Ammoniphilus sp. CFH 90114 TaxID=2493665 RepID=UPI00100F8266|nr:glycosyltransferase family 2 protein [Ammoniphilus sp. CFH 90114]RXT13975.1 glycosyltransferase family 2 protein [Ammoniphilus sp. CFH 90114]